MMGLLKLLVQVLGGITWLATVYFSFTLLGLGWGLAVLLFPPVTLIFMFVVGTWFIGLPVLILFIIHTVVGYRKENWVY
jgi:hypothetical protein